MRPHPHLYELNTRPWLHELSRRHGRPLGLGDVPPEEWDGLALLGFDLVYLMGVWERSAFGRHQSRTDPGFFAEYDAALPGWTIDDVLGSPFAIREYRPDPLDGDWDDLVAVREQLHRRGMGLILDFVPNHTGPDHPWVAVRPRYYVEGGAEDFRRDPAAYHLVEAGAEGEHRFVAKGRDPYFDPWPDTAQLHLGRQETRQALLDTVATLAGVCDGLRCDMAMLALPDVFTRTWGRLVGEPEPGELWGEAIAANPGLLFLAEVYWGMEGRLQDLGFHYTYDKALYDHVVGADAAAVRACLREDPQRQARHVRFLENHDEPRANAVIGPDRMEAAATLLATLPGLRFFHHGQLEGRVTRLPIRLRATAAEAADPVVTPLLRRLLRLADEDDFHSGAWRLLSARPVSGPDSLVAYAWGTGDRERVVVVNLGDSSAEAFLPVTVPLQPEQIAVVDDLHERTYSWRRADLADGLYVRLEGHAAHVLRLEPAG